MKRQLFAIALGSLLAMPAFANEEIDPGQASRTPFVNDYAAWVLVDAEQGYVARNIPGDGKTRAQVLAELVAAQRSGNFVINAELGLTARQMYPAQYAHKVAPPIRAEAASRMN